jgi:hypothetical protein
MYPTFSCPNPACTHTFSPKAVQGKSSLVCPKCGMEFQFASAPAAPASPPTAAKKTPPPQTPPPPPQTAVPIAQPVAGPAPLSFDFDSTAEREMLPSRRAVRKRGRGIGRWVVSVVALLSLVLTVWGVLWIVYLLKHEIPSDDDAPAISAFNARFHWPGKPWTRDKDLQRRFQVHIAIRSAEHNNSMALLFKDYKDRLPSDAELLDEAVTKLRAYFKGLEWELLPKDEPKQLAGHAAQALQFQGDDAEQVTVNGECYMLAFRGYGYWFFTWAPLGELEKDGEAIRAEWAELRDHFRLLDGRLGWKEKPRETVNVAGKKAKYRLAYLKGLWTHETSEEGDPQLDLLLKGHEPDPERRPLAAKDAIVQVLVLPPQSDLKSAAAAALAYVKQRETKLYERTVWEPVKDKNGESDRDAKIGTETGRLSKLHVKNTEELERYLALAVVNRPDGVIVLIGDCLWERRDFWDQEFTALFRSFRVK